MDGGADEGVLFLSRRDVRAMLTVRDAAEAVEEDLKRQAIPGASALGDPATYAQADRDLSFMWRLKSAIIREPAVAGVRVAGFKLDEHGTGSGSEEDSTRLIVLADPVTGSPLAIIDEHHSFGLRTVAAAAVAVKHLARPGPLSFGVVGAGHIGRLAVRAVAELFGPAEIRVTSRTPASRERLAADLSRELGLPVRASDSAEAVCRASDVVIACTPSRAPYIALEWLREGALVVSLGQEEVTHAAYAGCDRLFVDYERARGHPAHVAAALEAGTLREGDIDGELWEVVSGRLTGRTDPAERIVLVAVGLATQDIAIAHSLYRRARATGAGTRIPL